MTVHHDVPIAGVSWPLYKLVALVVGAVVLIAVGLVTASAGAAVLTATATATVVALGLRATAARR